MEEKLLETILEKSVNIEVYLNSIDFEEIEKIRPLIDERGELLRQFFSVKRNYTEREIALLRKIKEVDIVVQQMLEEKSSQYFKEFSGLKRKTSDEERLSQSRGGNQTSTELFLRKDKL